MVLCCNSLKSDFLEEIGIQKNPVSFEIRRILLKLFALIFRVSFFMGVFQVEEPKLFREDGAGQRNKYS